MVILKVFKIHCLFSSHRSFKLFEILPSANHLSVSISTISGAIGLPNPRFGLADVLGQKLGTLHRQEPLGESFWGPRKNGLVGCFGAKQGLRAEMCRTLTYDLEMSLQQP